MAAGASGRLSAPGGASAAHGTGGGDPGRRGCGRRRSVTPKDSRLVYSTNDPVAGKRCPKCGRYPCRCPKPVSVPPQQQTARIQCERKGRKGKTVTVVNALQLSPDDLDALGRSLRKLCGGGGTVKEGAIEVQGDHRERIAAELQRLGYKVKHVGG
ncbi:MAG: stress response translation initiation inhibitor YciH [Anaerolineae bacterium]|nr:stress response translation initiation inhibitor YciH [Anaerolineae bacterium]